MTSSKRMVNYLRKRGVKIGNNVFFKNSKRISIDLINPKLIEIGNNVFFNRDFTLLIHDAVNRVFREKYGVFLPNSFGKVKIGNNVSFARNVTVLKGVTIGDNVFVGHSSLVTKDIPSNCIVAGVPAKVICSLDDYFERAKQKCIEETRSYCKDVLESTGKLPNERQLSSVSDLFVDGSNIDEYLGSLGANKRKRAIKRMNGQFDLYKARHKAVYDGIEDMFVKMNLK